MRLFLKGGGVFAAGKAQQSRQLADELYGVAIALGGTRISSIKSRSASAAWLRMFGLAKAAANSATRRNREVLRVPTSFLLRD